MMSPTQMNVTIIELAMEKCGAKSIILTVPTSIEERSIGLLRKCAENNLHKLKDSEVPIKIVKESNIKYGNPVSIILGISNKLLNDYSYRQKFITLCYQSPLSSVEDLIAITI